jgi:hypothetical protein
MRDPTDAAFETAIDQWIVQAMAAGAASFDDLLVALPGVYPTLVQTALDRLMRRGVLHDDDHARLRERSPKKWSVVHYRPRRQILPIPHPLDYDWRFTPEAVALLVRESQHLNRGNGPLVLLGTPSVFQALTAAHHQPVVLLDGNPATIAALQPDPTHPSGSRQLVVQCDLGRDPLPTLRGSVVLLDPPWYNDYTQVFLWAATQLCQIGGHAMLSFPPEGTRPGIAHDMRTITDWAAELGWELVGRAPGVLGYVTPPFEQNALAAAGLVDLPDGWRRGDLIVLRRVRHADRPRPCLHQTEHWSEVLVDGVRIRFRADSSNCYGNPALRSLVDGDVLDSVSRRWARRREVRVWTSANRVFACQATTVLRELVAALAERADPYHRIEQYAGRSLTADERSEVAAAMTQVNELLAVERHDMTRWGWAVPSSAREVGNAEPAA